MSKLRWSCDERDRTNCRNAHGCHCREITSLLAARPEPMPLQSVPRNLGDQRFEVTFTAPAFWCPHAKRWRFNREAKVDYVPANARWVGPVDTAVLTAERGKK
jgi:hypothetical protein